MATISVRAGKDRRLVMVRGGLRAQDLRRLERACGPALEHRVLALELRFTEPDGCDEVAQAFVAGLVKRGAVLS